jgi:hypothetical protein
MIDDAQSARQFQPARPNKKLTPVDAKDCPAQIVITVSPDKRPGRYRAYVEAEQEPLCVSRQPFLDGARKLLAKGHHPLAMLVMRWAGATDWALRGPLAAAAKLTVDEHNGTYAKWKPLSRSAVPPKIAKTANQVPKAGPPTKLGLGEIAEKGRRGSSRQDGQLSTALMQPQPNSHFASNGGTIMKSTLVQEVSAEYLRSGQPRLVCRVEPQGGGCFEINPYIRQGEYGWEEVIREGYDPDLSPLGCPVYWRVVNRGDEQFYCSTFVATRDQVIKIWGPTGLAHCDPYTGLAFARIETKSRKRDCHDGTEKAVSTESMA